MFVDVSSVYCLFRFICDMIAARFDKEDVCMMVLPHLAV